MHFEYPKSLYLKGWDDLSANVTVNSPDEEAAARKDGYKALNESAAEPAVAEKPARKPRAKKAE